MKQFDNSQSLSQLAEQGIFVEIKENPKTKKLFMVDEAGNTLGAVAEKLVAKIRNTGELDNNWVISDFTPEDGSETFKMLHEKAEGVPSIASSRPKTIATAKSKKAF